MTSHELARKLLELPEVGICTVKSDKKNELIPVTDLCMFKGTTQSAYQIGILAHRQTVTGHLYWLGSSPYEPSGRSIDDFKTAQP